MFTTVGALKTRIEDKINLIEINKKVLSGELENPNGYSEEYINEVIAEQIESLYKLLEILKRYSSSERVISRYTKLIDTVVNK